MILALDTTSEFGSLALAEGERVIEVVSLRSREGFAHLIFQQIQALVARHGKTLDDLDGFAAAAGPGSFSGVRVGLTAVKGLAEATGKRVAPVSNLLAMAYAGQGTRRAAVIQARRGEVYGAVYDEQLRPVVAEMVGPCSRFLEAIGALEVTFVISDPTPIPDLIAGTRFAGAPVATVARELAGAVACVAARLFAQGGSLAPEAVDANYIRRADAEEMWKPQ